MIRLQHAAAEDPRSLLLRNRQRDCSVNLPALRRLVRYHLNEQLRLPAYEIAIHLVATSAMAEANQAHLGHEGPTDVITFDYSEEPGKPSFALESKTGILPVSNLTQSAPAGFKAAKSEWHNSERWKDSRNAGPSSERLLHGELLVCPAVAVLQAKDFGTTWPSELVRYIIHGILHLQGYDDRVAAKRRVMKREENRRLTALEQLYPSNGIRHQTRTRR